jgi:DNA modification methylase
MSALRDVKLVSVRRLKPNKRNARTHSKKQIQQIANSIVRFGWTIPILVDEDGNIIAGHGRYLAALLLGIGKVPVIVVQGLSDSEKRALAIADNKIPANAGWDREALTAELAELASLLPEGDIGLTGFEPPEIDQLLADAEDTPNADPDQVPDIAVHAVSKLGDVWHLGNHTLACGDALDPATLRSLLKGTTAALVITDPPYNVKIRTVVGRGRMRHREFAQASGELAPAEFVQFLQTFLSNIAGHLEDGAIAFVCMDWRHCEEMLAASKPVFGAPLNIVVWVKTNAGQGSFYRSQHEFVFVFRNGNGPHQNHVELGRYGRNRSNVWNYAGTNTFRAGRMDDLAAHPTVKPVAMFADAMRDCSKRGETVLDPFAGSGTTILAAEQVGRHAVALDIDPLYVDVAIRRWQQYTRRDAVHVASGKTFDEIAAVRQVRP